MSIRIRMQNGHLLQVGDAVLQAVKTSATSVEFVIEPRGEYVRRDAHIEKDLKRVGYDRTDFNEFADSQKNRFSCVEALQEVGERTKFNGSALDRFYDLDLIAATVTIERRKVTVTFFWDDECKRQERAVTLSAFADLRSVDEALHELCDLIERELLANG